jgi:hypothetical protein
MQHITGARRALAQGEVNAEMAPMIPSCHYMLLM